RRRTHAPSYAIKEPSIETPAISKPRPHRRIGAVPDRRSQLDASGFVRRVQFFAGNASEPTTLKGMLTGLDAAPGATVVMDAGIATEANLLWLREQGLHYVVVSKLRERQFDPALATEVQSAGDVTIKLQRVLD